MTMKEQKMLLMRIQRHPEIASMIKDGRSMDYIRTWSGRCTATIRGVAEALSKLQGVTPAWHTGDFYYK